MEPFSEQLHSILYYGDPSKHLSHLSTKFSHYTQDQAKEILKFLKATIKAKKNPPIVKLQALKVIECLMSSKNIFILDYCGKKFYNRFKIYAEYKKESSNDRRGTLLFNSEAKLQQIASEDFLILLLKCIKTWSENFGTDSKGRPTQYIKLFNYLKAKNVHFPADQNLKEREAVKTNLCKIKKNVKVMNELINDESSPGKIKKIGNSLKTDYKTIQEHIVKYMDMEDHELIKDLNMSLDLLEDAQKNFKAWKSRLQRSSIIDMSSFELPPTCLLLDDICPKILPAPDDLSASLQEIPFDDISPRSMITDRETEYEKEFTMSAEWIGLGADYCRLKDKLDLTEQDVTYYKNELERLQLKLLEEQEEKEYLRNLTDTLTENIDKLSAESKEKTHKLTSENSLLKEQNKLLCDNLANFEEKVEKLKQEAVAKKETIENLENTNALLTSACKNLEYEVEKYAESEEFLKKEIKDLFKKVEKRKPEKDSGSLSSNSEVQINNDESPTKDGRISLIGKLEEIKYDTGPFGFETFTEPITEEKVFEDINPEGFLPSRAPTNMFNQIDNVKYYKECMKKRQGVLFDSEYLKGTIFIEVHETHGNAEIVFENKTDNEMTNFKTKVYADPADGLRISISEEKTEVLSKESPVCRILAFDCNEFFQVFPLLRVTFVHEGSKNQCVFLLPIAYTLFCVKPNIDFIKEWDGVEECRETVSKTSIESIKKIARSLLFNKNVEYSYIEGNGVILASESPIGLVLAVVILKDTQVFIQVKSKESKVRDLISSMIVTQVLADSLS